ncbi:hypothetical protein GH714_004482 [Hevea brasiliensis]|uniref:BHLH domain-containing protein n=1 Tax=Hevea brasiliensis TaxID=3981 RepID=A0A6A6MBR4_HEVBR|nr:hypothetical protein GH714_004482 [Hevea brasiliensis]
MNMETLGAFPDGEWDFSRMFSTQDQIDITPELLGQCSFPLENDGGFQFTNPLDFSSNPEANVNMAGVDEKKKGEINERLRILQNLVPNGTKVDISTMLEEAVHYVKFLQLQIKLLSSDDLWMYAPIACNGMDIGLNQKISMLQ